MSDKILSEYIHKMTMEKESLCAKFIAETGLSPSEVVLCEAPTTDKLGRVFFFDRKSKYDPGTVYLTREEAEELKRVLIEGDHIDDVLDVLNRAMTEAEPEFPEKEFQDFIESAAARDSEGDYRRKTIAKWAWDRRGKAGT